ncbi:MAG: hypothetical protein J4F36_12390 [Nitrosopumilaceae archaeon]|nr:hypothetical protein [Nitrosopumilaceae archaeon]
MQRHLKMCMDSRITLFTVLALAAVFAMALPMDSVYAQTTDIMPDGEGGDGEGKSCPFKNKTASVNTGLNI